MHAPRIDCARALPFLFVLVLLAFPCGSLSAGASPILYGKVDSDYDGYTGKHYYFRGVVIPVDGGRTRTI